LIPDPRIKEPNIMSATEERNPRTHDIDRAPTRDAVDLILAEDAAAIAAAQAAADRLALAVDRAAAVLAEGGRIHYFGAGASGRLAVLDATELTPTFGVERSAVQAHFPGGVDALVDSSLDFEDAFELGRADADVLREGDLAFGITASGSTAYVAGALERAAEVGAARVLLTCNPDTEIAADIVVVADTGPEALTGSTRLKAGTATKVLLNAFSTALMISRGRTYSNLMAGMTVSNTKLRRRAAALLSEASGAHAEAIDDALTASSDHIDVALVCLRTGLSAAQATRLLELSGGSLRDAIARGGLCT
jgi:N-acetylmuramic acid 6-phosphate etherase